MKFWVLFVRANRYTWALTALVGLLVFIFLVTIKAATVEARWAVHSAVVGRDAGRFNFEVAEAGSGMRAMLAAGDPRYRKDYEKWREQAEGRLDALRRLTEDNEFQQAQINVVRVETARKFRELDGIVDLASAGRLEEARGRFNSGVSANIHSALLRAVANFMDEEDRLLQERQGSAILWFSVAVVTSILISCFLSWVAVKWWEDYKRIKAEEDAPRPPPPVEYPPQPPGGMTPAFNRRKDDPKF